MRGQRRGDPPSDGIPGLGAALSSDFLAIAIEHQRWNAPYASRAGSLLAGLGIDLGKTNRRQSLRRLLKVRGHRLAGATPGGPVVHQHRQFAACDEGLDRSLGEIHGGGRGQLGSASATDRMIRQALFRNPIGGCAMRAGQVHGRFPGIGAMNGALVDTGELGARRWKYNPPQIQPA